MRIPMVIRHGILSFLHHTSHAYSPPDIPEIPVYSVYSVSSSLAKYGVFAYSMQSFAYFFYNPLIINVESAKKVTNFVVYTKYYRIN